MKWELIEVLPSLGGSGEGRGWRGLRCQCAVSLLPRVWEVALGPGAGAINSSVCFIALEDTSSPLPAEVPVMYCGSRWHSSGH